MRCGEVYGYGLEFAVLELSQTLKPVLKFRVGQKASPK